MREHEVQLAVKRFWIARARGTQSDEHPKPFLDLIATDLRRRGWKDVRTKAEGKAGITVGGWFRPAKEWDIVCWRDSKPSVAVEMKTQVGSYGNNENNRYEEALGNALDLRAKYRHEVHLGFVFIICDEVASRRPMRPRVRDVDPVFLGSSHVDRRLVFAKRILSYQVKRRPLYDSAAVLMIRRDGSYEHPADKSLRISNLASSLPRA
jgi:hypothetical protein